MEVSNFEKVLNQLKGVMVKAESSTSSEMLEAFELAAKTLERETRDKTWTTDAGQTELLRRLKGSARPPSSSTSSTRANGLCLFDCSA